MSKFIKTVAVFSLVAAFAVAGVASASFDRDLTVGSTGADVSALQTTLGMTTVTGYFGEMTKAAVVAFQTQNGITPAAGYVGAKTRAVLNAVTTTTTTTTTTTSTVAGCAAGALFSSTTGASCANTSSTNTSTNSSSLNGSDGSIADVSELSAYSNEEVGEGEDNVKVLGFEVEASNEGDIQLKSIKISMSENGTGDSSNLDDYIGGISVYMGSTKVGSADVEDFNEDSNGNYSKTVSLSNVVVEADDTVKFYVTADAAGTFDSGDIDGLDWSMDVENIRYTDGSGVTSTYTGNGGDFTAMNVAIDFVGFGDSADTELKISKSSDSPEAMVVKIDDADTTDDVVLLKGKMKLDGSSDVVIDELPITLTVAGATDVADVTGTVKLTIDGEEYSESVASATTTVTVLFNNLDLTLEAGKTVEFEISADIEGTDGDMNDGYTLLASITTTNRGNIDVENEEGEALNDGSELTGSAIGSAQTFYENAINVSSFTSSKTLVTSDAGATTKVTYDISFKVAAFGDTFYIPKTIVQDTTSTTAGLVYTVYDETAGAVTTSGTESASLLSSSAETVDDYFEIPDGETETFTATISVATGSITSGHYIHVQLGAIGYDLDQSGDVSGLSLTPAQDYDTGSVSLD